MRFKAPLGMVSFSHRGKTVDIAADGILNALPSDKDALLAHGFVNAEDDLAVEAMSRGALLDAVMALKKPKFERMSDDELRMTLLDLRDAMAPKKPGAPGDSRPDDKRPADTKTADVKTLAKV